MPLTVTDYFYGSFLSSIFFQFCESSTYACREETSLLPHEEVKGQCSEKERHVSAEQRQQPLLVRKGWGI
jgi:hypothetical protein